MLHSLVQAARHGRRLAIPTSVRRSTALFSTQAQEAETFLSGTSSVYAEQMYEMYLEDPETVHPSWKQYFDNLENGIAFSVEDYSRPSTIQGKRAVANSAVSPAPRGSLGTHLGAHFCDSLPSSLTGSISNTFLFRLSRGSFLSCHRTPFHPTR